MIRCPHCSAPATPLSVFLAAASGPSYVCHSCGEHCPLAQHRISLLSGINGALMALAICCTLRLGWEQWTAVSSTVALGCVSMMTLLLCFGRLEPPDKNGPRHDAQ